VLELVRGAGLSRVLLLAQEDPYTEAGERLADRGAFYVPNQRVLDLARRHPEFAPAVSIHPARADAMEELERCLAGGAAAMKCLPNCQNIDPRLPRYRRFWERMAEAGLPLLAHTGGENVLPELRPDLADPRVHATPLEIGVTVIAAHCGSGVTRGRDFFPAFEAMLPRHPRLYGDISAICFPRKIGQVGRLLRPETVERLVHGSDFPVPVNPLWAWLYGRLAWRTAREVGRIENPLARCVALVRALGFPPEVFTRIASIWRTPGPG
jgi:predicted TIM-barrel fold metal-dependent hydrolase